MKHILAGALSLGLGLTSLSGIASAQTPAGISTNADGSYVTSRAGVSPTADGGGGTVIYGDITTGPGYHVVSAPTVNTEPAPVADPVEPAPEDAYVPEDTGYVPEDTTRKMGDLAAMWQGKAFGTEAIPYVLLGDEAPPQYYGNIREQGRLVREAAPGLPVIASGGLRDGVDIAKCIALGAVLGGMAGPFLRAAADSVDAVRALIWELTAQVRIAMFASGAATIAALQQTPLVRID